MPQPTLVAGTIFATTQGDQPFTLLDALIAQIITRINLTASDFGGYRTSGLVGQNDAVTPNSKYGFSADLVELRNPLDNTVIVKTNTGTLTNDDTVVGPVVNGRDQVAVFAASTWIHFYFIWNGITLGTLSSLSAPPTGPTLPAGYTHWCYLGAVHTDGSSNLSKTRVRGSWVFYETQQLALSNGTATTETAVVVSSFVPPNALQYSIEAFLDVALAAQGNQSSCSIRLITGSGLYNLKVTSQVASQTTEDSAVVNLPNLAQQFLYILSGTAPSTGGFSVWVQGFQVPNGAE